MITEQTYTLADVVDENIIMQQIDKKKYFVGYMVIAKMVWRYLYQNTIYAVQSEWQPLRAGIPYNYIDIPKGVRILSIAENDHCGNVVPLFYNSELNVIPKPLVNTCGCTACDCGSELCGCLNNSLIKTTKLLFTINGVDYYQTTWIKVCPNGDILQYDQIPTKKFNSFVGDGGDYNSDYNNDYLIGNPPFSDYTIVTVTEQKIICNIPLKPCGCPIDTPEVREKFFTHCGSFINCDAECYRKRCEQELLSDTNSNYRGEVKISDCGTKMYYKPNPKRGNHFKEKLPEYLLVNFQTSGENCSSEVLVPNNEANLLAMHNGIDWYKKRFNNKYSLGEKEQAKFAWNNSINELILYLNPLSLNIVENIQDTKIRW